eukprot:4264207-Alexandrium_andersonii.AAC.1
MASPTSSRGMPCAARKGPRSKTSTPSSTTTPSAVRKVASSEATCLALKRSTSPVSPRGGHAMSVAAQWAKKERTSYCASAPPRCSDALSGRRACRKP